MAHHHGPRHHDTRNHDAGPTARVHLTGTQVAEPGWGVSAAFAHDHFDAVAMETAMRVARRRAYAALADLDAA